MFPPLQAIVDAEAAGRAGWELRDLAAAYLDGGAQFIQVRAKMLPGGALLDLCDRIVSLAGPYGARVIVNDRADLARMSGADGVHVGQDDLPVPAVRALVGPSAIVGYSTHTPEQVEAARPLPLSYVAIGPVFRTTSKETGHAAVGLEMVRLAARLASGRPVVAIGGITLETAPAVLAAGATTVAVISDLLATGDPAARVEAYRRLLG